ncbi:MAG: biotin synthase BioB [Candidatus Omnitrophota bacterium]
MRRSFYQQLAQDSISGKEIPRGIIRRVLTGERVNLLRLLDAAFEVREKFTGRVVKIHILNNLQNGHCPEDCHYCAQSKVSAADISRYPMKSDEEIIAEAKNAYRSGAFRYCMVFSGRCQSRKRIEHLAVLVRTIKKKYPIEVCVSPGRISREDALILKKAGLDRLNHNLNTSRRYYSRICTTHTYAERIQTLRAAQDAGLQICSGVIVGMGETTDDVIDAARALRKLHADSIPVNFFLPIRGLPIKDARGLTPEYCLRVLCVYRLLNPRAEIRIAAGREFHLRSLEALALYPANSLFLDGYLNVAGEDRMRTLRMIRDAGFTIQSEHKLDELINKNGTELPENAANRIVVKNLNKLRPAEKSQNKHSKKNRNRIK